MIKEISHAKDKLIGPETLLTATFAKQIGRIYGEYQSLLATANALDFDDIIFRTVNLRGNEEEAVSMRFYVSVDEYQDVTSSLY